MSTTKGMMTGVSADRFAPASTTTRGMIVTILYRLENRPAVSGGSAFTDVESGAWYADAVAWAAANDTCQRHQRHHLRPQQPHHPGADGGDPVPVCRLQGI